MIPPVTRLTSPRAKRTTTKVENQPARAVEYRTLWRASFRSVLNGLISLHCFVVLRLIAVFMPSRPDKNARPTPLIRNPPPKLMGRSIWANITNSSNSYLFVIPHLDYGYIAGTAHSVSAKWSTPDSHPISIVASVVGPTGEGDTGWRTPSDSGSSSGGFFRLED